MSLGRLSFNETYLQFKHPVLTLGLLRRPRLVGLAASILS